VSTHSSWIPRQVLVIGASRGLGLAFVAQYAAAGARVLGTARDAEGRARIEAAGGHALTLDLTRTASVAGLAWQIDGEAFDLVLINAGVYGPRSSGLQPPTEAEFDQVMHTNVLGPMRVLPAVGEALAPGARLAVISSRMGSMGLRSSAGGWLYRASKAALNSVLCDAAQVLRGRALCVALHPGWVRTDMGGPEADLDLTPAVAALRATLAAFGPEAHGGFFDPQGERLPW